MYYLQPSLTEKEKSELFLVGFVCLLIYSSCVASIILSSSSLVNSSLCSMGLTSSILLMGLPLCDWHSEMKSQPFHFQISNSRNDLDAGIWYFCISLYPGSHYSHGGCCITFVHDLTVGPLLTEFLWIGIITVEKNITCIIEDKYRKQSLFNVLSYLHFCYTRKVVWPAEGHACHRVKTYIPVWWSRC